MSKLYFYDHTIYILDLIYISYKKVTLIYLVHVPLLLAL